MGDSNSTILLQCIQVSIFGRPPSTIRVDGSPFQVEVPAKGVCGEIVGAVVKVSPSLQGVDHKRFSLYKPPLTYSITLSYDLNGRGLSPRHLTEPLLPSCSVMEMFPENGDGSRCIIDVIVHVEPEVKDGTGSFVLQPLHGRSKSNLLTCVTFQLRYQAELQLPPEDLLDENGLIKSQYGPDFVELLEKELWHLRSPIGFHGATAHMLDCLRALLGESFGEYFADSSDASDMRRVSDLELLHYIVALFDTHLGNKAAYVAKPEPHIYSLLGRFTEPPPHQPDMVLQCGTSWSFRLVVEVQQNQFQYTPRSDFAMSIKSFPHLLVEVVSNKNGGKDKNRMLLQASRLVRLGNSLLGKPCVFVKAIYFDSDFQAFEYTLYQRGTEPDSKVEYSELPHDLSQRLGLFKLIFRLYNFRLSVAALHGKLSPKLADALSSIRDDTKGLPAITSKHGLGDSTACSTGSSLKRKRDLASRDTSSMGGRLHRLQV
ncbi:hypothetical protein EDB83DRAFT_2522897 [Lactarius deliciosus]|nr:hypothetical protein EDB83DRAFT_2522897 [Lactarius deliciosus]